MENVGIFAAAKMAHLSDDKTVAKMGHPSVGSGVCHPTIMRGLAYHLNSSIPIAILVTSTEAG